MTVLYNPVGGGAPHCHSHLYSIKSDGGLSPPFLIRLVFCCRCERATIPLPSACKPFCTRYSVRVARCPLRYAILAVCPSRFAGRGRPVSEAHLQTAGGRHPHPSPPILVPTIPALFEWNLVHNDCKMANLCVLYILPHSIVYIYVYIYIYIIYMKDVNVKTSVLI